MGTYRGEGALSRIPLHRSTLFEYYRTGPAGDRVTTGFQLSTRTVRPGGAMISLVELVAICSVATLTAAGASQGWDRLRRPRVNRSTDREKSAGDGSGRPSAGAWHEPRYDKRHSVRCPIEYQVGAHRQEGILIDMSRRGWRAAGPSPVLAGTLLSVRVFFPDAA